MAKNLVIVESPAKARTIGRYLGRAYTVKASLGHIRDLPSGRMSIDVDEQFAPKYVIPKEKKALVKDLNDALEGTTTVYLATDPDREGEAIAWHLTQAIKIGNRAVKRVVFHEITEAAIKEAFKQPREIDLDLVNAQQTRRILDRLVGYRLSPLLWKKIRGGLSAGRVQSPALSILVDREREIEAFVPEEYWKLIVELSKVETAAKRQKTKFLATLTGIKGARKKLEVHDTAHAHEIVHDLAGAAYEVATVTSKETQRRPTAPFTTSTLQQEAFRKLRYTAVRTMHLAQQLYEGLAVGSEGTVGLITYMRTDSPVVSASAIQEARAFIRDTYGADYTPKDARIYTTRSKSAQEAHEAIRPTSIRRTPAAIKAFLEPAQFRLYDLIWKRLVASQMANAIFDATTVDIEAAQAGHTKTYIFHATGSVQKFAGFLHLYSEGKDAPDDEDDGALPLLEKGEALNFLRLDPQQKFTQPPPRFTEATLVKTLEENGIGRPSTYAPIVSTIVDRGYVQKEAGSLRPQNLGLLVNDLLQESFPDIIDTQFTAHMEEQLDEVARGEKAWVPMLKEFYGPFDKAVTAATENLPKTQEATAEVCDLCGKPMVITKGRFGLFLACSGFPECFKVNTKDKQVANTKPLVTADSPAMPQETTEEVCHLCGKPMVIKRSRFGLFLACTGYPACFKVNAAGKKVGNTKPFLVKVGVKCPEDGGELVEKRSQKGITFYSCANYPNCKFITRLRPIPDPCPQCGGLLGSNARGVKCTKCTYKAAPLLQSAREPALDQEAEKALVPAGVA